MFNNNSHLGKTLGSGPNDSKPGGLPITLLVCGIVILLVLIAIGLMLIYVRLCFEQPASAAPGMFGAKGYLKGGLKGPKGGFKGGYGDPKGEASAQSGKSFSSKQQGMMASGKAVSYERQTLKSKQPRFGKQGYSKPKQGGKNQKQYVGKRSGSSTSSGQSKQRQYKGSKSKKNKHHRGKSGPSDQTMLYKQSVQYYKQFLKSVHSVKSVSEYFEKKP